MKSGRCKVCRRVFQHSGFFRQAPCKLRCRRCASLDEKPESKASLDEKPESKASLDEKPEVAPISLDEWPTSPAEDNELWKAAEDSQTGCKVCGKDNTTGECDTCRSVLLQSLAEQLQHETKHTSEKLRFALRVNPLMNNYHQHLRKRAEVAILGLQDAPEDTELDREFHLLWTGDVRKAAVVNAEIQHQQAMFEQTRAFEDECELLALVTKNSGDK